ncbi:hypothetical protein ACEQ8H_006161 [Pleosporales sp. CAS-2024a]
MEYQHDAPRDVDHSLSHRMPISLSHLYRPSGDYIWKISDFSARKLNGVDNSAISFTISPTNANTAGFTCSSSADTNTTLSRDTFYSCGEGSFISFSFEGDSLTSTRLLFKQDVSDSITEFGTTTVPYYCHAGGAAPNDFVCQQVADSYVTLVQLPPA